jgi:patatin-like phospholipase/acyl hydrolase
MRETKLEDIEKDICIPAVCITSSAPTAGNKSPTIYAFTKYGDGEELLTDVIMASCAAPMYFG